MNEKPIIFTGEMVCGILDDRKLQTRRVIKAPVLSEVRAPDSITNSGVEWTFTWSGDTTYGGFTIKCPYGQKGTRLWVRESYYYNEMGKKAPICCHYKATADPDCVHWKWTHSIHMPRWASRITLEVTGIRVERVQDITEADAKAEGISESLFCAWMGSYGLAFCELWDSINAKPKPVKDGDGDIARYESYPFDGEKKTRTYRGKPWHINPNPWVWVVEFRRIEP